MANKIDLKELDSKIQSMKKTAEELRQMGETFQPSTEIPAVF